MKRERKKREILMSAKRKAAHGLAGFLIFMLVCTFVSRGIYAYHMPQVKVASAKSGALSHEFETSGTVEAVSEKAVTVLSGVRVQEVCVEEGETVKKGDALFRLDTKELKNRVSRLQKETAELEEEKDRQEMAWERQKEQARETEKRSRKRQREDMDALEEELEELVQKTEKEYQSACEEVSSYPGYEAYLSEQKDSSMEYLTLKAAAEKKEAGQSEKEAFSIFLVTFERGVKKEWQQGKKALQDARDTARQAWRDARQNKKDTLNARKKENARSSEDAGDRKEEDASLDVQVKKSLSDLQEKIYVKRRSMKTCEGYLKRNGEVLCGGEGVVQKIFVEVGERTPTGAAVRYSDASGGFRFSAVLTKEQEKYLKVGDEVELSFQEGTVTLEGILVSSIQSRGEGEYLVRAEFETDKVAQGQEGTMKVSAESVRQECYIPVSGLYAGGTENYVLVLREKETFLGTEYSVEKRTVDVSDKNDKYAALKGSPIAGEEQIIISSDRPVRAGSSVRMMEDENEGQ